MNASVALLFILSHCGGELGNKTSYNICRKEAVACLIRQKSTEVCSNQFLIKWMAGDFPVKGDK